MNVENKESPVPELDNLTQVQQRRAKLAHIRQGAAIAFPNQFRPNVFTADLHAEYDGEDSDNLVKLAKQVSVAGRIMSRRLMGKASFISLQDMSGRIQLYLSKEEIGEEVGLESYEASKEWDLGDIIGVTGCVFKTKTGELTIRCKTIQLLTKTLQPLPDKFHGLADQELCYRRRYLDLLVNEKSRKVFQMRSRIVASIRQFFEKERFLEVETPMMHPIPGGAAARPFLTHHNALDMDLYLRIAPELYLKRLIIGGFERVFEINRNFRNEGLSTRHNPEFTMIEFYQAYADYEDLMGLTENLLRYLTQKLFATNILLYQGNSYDLTKPFRRLTVFDAILHFNPEIKSSDLEDINSARIIAEKCQVTIHPNDGLGKIQIGIFEKTVEKKLQEPTFITAYPTEVSPLARINDKNPFVTDRFEFFVAGQEIANGFSELNDPEDQELRFKRQVQEREAGDAEAMYYDADYITALEHGMPPTAGEGIGIDRLVMLLTDCTSIRDVILFPLLRNIS